MEEYWNCNVFIFFLIDLTERLGCCLYKYRYFASVKMSENHFFQSWRTCISTPFFKTIVYSTRGIQYFLSVVVFCELMYNCDLFHLDMVNCAFYLSKDKIQYQYDHLFAHCTSLHNHTLIHCRFNMSRKQDKVLANTGVYVDST